MVHGKDMNLVRTNQPVDNSIRAFEDFTHCPAFEFGDDSSRFRKVLQPVDGSNQPSDDDGCIVRGILLDESADRRQIRNRLVGPANRSHARKRFLTSS